MDTIYKNMNIFWVILISFFITFLSQPSEGKIHKKDVTSKIQGLSIPFIQNNGLVNKKVAFFAHTFRGTVFLTKDKTIVYAFPSILKPSSKKNSAQLFVVKESFCGTRVSGALKGESEAATRITFIKGKEPRSWHRGVKAFNRIDFGDVYPGIALSLKAHANNVEKIFTVAPGRNPSEIRVEVAGVQKLDMDKQGRLLLISSLGYVVLSRPIAYQIVSGKKRYVTASYMLHNSGYSFRVGNYDRTKPLYIDPIISATFLGGSDNSQTDDTGWDIANDIVVDGSGYVYVVGETQSSDFPTTNGVVNTNYNNSDGFISKFNPDLTQLIASTFIGGNGSDEVTNIIIDKQTNNILIAGTTSSTNFPTTEGAYDSSLIPGSDKVFVCKLSSDLGSIINSTLLGDSDSQQSVHALAIDNEGNVFVAGEVFGYTENYPDWTSDFPVTAGAYDTSYNGTRSDAFISKFDSNLTELMASSFLGGSSDDQINSIAIGQDGKVFVAGYTSSDDFPVTSGAYQSTNPSEQSGFISSFSPDLSELYASTYLGGSDSSSIATIVIGPEGNIFATGTTGPGFPTTPGAIQPEFNGNSGANGFICKINPNLTQLLASTYISKEGVFIGTNLSDLAVGNGATLYAVGDPFAGGENDALIVRVNLDLTKLLGMIQFGGQGDTDLDSRDSATAIAIGPDGTVYTAGFTYSEYFPVTDNAYDVSFNGLCDAFVARFDRELDPAFYYKLTIAPEPQNGEIQISDGEEIAPPGSTITLQAIPNEGYILSSWDRDCSGCEGTTCTITMDSDKTCTAEFEPVSNVPPVIDSFTAEPTSGTAPLTVTFTCQAHDNDGQIVSYGWDFDGDGTVDETSEAGTISHTYQDPGTYQVRCTVTDNDGDSVTSESQEITVNKAAPSWVDITDTLNITHSTRQLYDRIHRCFFIQVTVANPGEEAISGPVRLVITNPSIPVKTGVGVGLDPDGYTNDGDPYFIIVPEDGTLDAGGVLRNLRINFDLRRARLTYGVKIERLEQ